MCYGIPAVVAAFAAASAIAQPAFEPTEPSVLLGDVADVRVTGLDPGSLATIAAERYSGRSQSWYRSTAVFRADDAGQIDPINDEPVAAPWSGVDVAGFFWTMQTIDGAAYSEETTPWRTIQLHVDADGDGTVDASTRLRLDDGADVLVETSLGEAFQGAFVLRPPGDEPLPAIILLGGSEGGDRASRGMAPLLASRGYLAVGVPYYSPAWGTQEQQFPDLPRGFAGIPVDRLADVLDAVRAREDVIEDAIGVWGVSKGAEFALAAASRIDGFAAVAAIVPSDVIWEGWGSNMPGPSSFSWEGTPMDYVPYLGMGAEFAKGRRGQAVRIRLPHDAGRLANPERVEAARIRVEDIDEPVFVVGGDEDNTWDSGGMARNIAERRESAGLNTVLIVDAEAGHALSGHAYTPLSEADARVRKEAFPALLAFFAEHLKRP
ncbi:MAG: acyl-CoA thioesterase/bile acid-CoA:amino acid N-acyltransferase family protein [Planctomycetota bacterium]